MSKKVLLVNYMGDNKDGSKCIGSTSITFKNYRGTESNISAISRFVLEANQNLDDVDITSIHCTNLKTEAEKHIDWTMQGFAMALGAMSAFGLVSILVNFINWIAG
ncbi:hypothetical protein LVJ82_00685 [Vitreoscilla massiliensis]|uniref:Uncharacterized protein n=1 Tax=Vitreoscilla massiliensis TaxID=1689272 RepID=A0ABY4E159_9NEIS|nr:hypothetical protein [Vitreoscilla massiliensis]UOO89531.1 hypothetical protein LVJ82_00685 [Vitreoscilla massiliensis]